MMKQRVHISLLILLGLGLGVRPSVGQASSAGTDLIRFRHLGLADGLPQEDVHVVYQDTLGFLWFGTEDGLVRYDGHDLRIFKPAPFDTASLHGAWIVGLAPDDDDGMWIALEDEGLDRYDARTESFASIDLGMRAEGVSRVRLMLRTRAGAVWIGKRDDGLVRYDPATGRADRFRHRPGRTDGPGGNQITALLEDATGRVWIGTESRGLDRYDPVQSDPPQGDPGKGVFHHYRHDPADPASIPHDEVGALLLGADRTLWVGAGGGQLARYDAEADAFTTVYRSAGGLVTALLEDPDGALWIGTEAGLDRFDPATGKTDTYRHDPADPTTIGSGRVHTLFLDRSGVFWVGTESGLSRFVWGAPRLPRLTHVPDDPHSLSAPGVWTFLVDRRGALWVGTEAGLDRYDARTGRFVHYRHDPADPTSLTPGWVMALHEDADGLLWVGTRGNGVLPGGLNRFDPATGSVVRRYIADPADPAALPTDNPWALYEDGRGRLWVLSGGQGCISVLDRAAGVFQPRCNDPADPNTPSQNAAKRMVETADGTIWLATWGGGLDRIDPETGAFTHYRHDPADANTPADDTIMALHLDPHGALWLGTYGAGLDRFDPATETFTHFNEGNSDLPNNVVYGIAGDDEGGIWVSTNRGLTRFDPVTGMFRTYGLDDGLQDLEFNTGAAYRAPDGELFFGGINGFNRFYPERLAEAGSPPPVVLTGLRIRGMPVDVAPGETLSQALPYTAALRLGSEQRDIAVTFAALDFATPERNRYRYRLEGYDDAWRMAGPERSATYTNLDPGTYTFRVQAASGSGLWSPDGAALTLTLAAPWWQTPWAYLLYVLLAFAAAAIFARYRGNRIVLQHRLEIEHFEAEKLRELDRARSRFFANVSHEFRTPLTLTIGPLNDLLAGLCGPITPEAAEQVDLARRNAERVLSLVNQILDVARLEAGRMRLRARPVDPGLFVATLARSFAPLAERKAVTLTVDAPPAGPVCYADPVHLEKIVANLLSNALKFTPDGGAVRVTAGVGPKRVRIAVRDSGPGIPEEDLARVFDRFYQADQPSVRLQPGTGIGLALARELVELHGGEIGVESEVGFGSTFFFVLPLGRNHLADDHLAETDAPWTPDVEFFADPARPYTGAESSRTEDALDALDDLEEAADVTTLLVVEDNPDIRAYVRRHLGADFRVVEAAGGEEGLAKARAIVPDLVLSDVMMDGMDGYALCQALKSDPETDFIPVVLLTAKAAPEDRLEGLREQADDYLTKPFDVAELRARIDNLIASRRRLRARFAAGGDGSGDGAAALHPTRIEVRSADETFLAQVRAAIEDRMHDDAFGVRQLADAVGLSRSQLRRRLQAAAGRSPSEVIRSMRLERAGHLLEQRAGTVGEVAYAVGFKSTAHFSNCFFDCYGVRPSAYSPGISGVTSSE